VIDRDMAAEADGQAPRLEGGGHRSRPVMPAQAGIHLCLFSF
jgi:hypothetical protein